jgi:glycosyltransferase involved in cell wall biosynthesis
MPSVVIAAHNEAAVLGPCLDSLLDDALLDEFEVVVVANGCTDRTADVARARNGVRVVEIERPSKVAALNAADALATRFPRIYLDADIVVTTSTIRALCDALDGPGRPLVAVPSRRLELEDRPLTVRAFYAIQRRLPVFEEGLFGRGLVALSREGRSRFGVFPEVVADDLFLDSLFAPDERVRLPDLATSVATPMRTGDLLHRLVRVRRGNAVLRTADLTEPLRVRPPDRWSWLRDVVLPRPWLAPAATLYVGITSLAAYRAKHSLTDPSWGRDESSRVAGR